MTRAEDAARLKRRRALALCTAGVTVLALPWLALVPMAVFRGVAVIERCDRKASDQFAPEAVHAVRGAEFVRAFPPAWVCPLDNGDSVSVSILG